MSDQKMLELGALWKKVSERTGNAFYTGDIDFRGETIKIIAFDNDRKTKDSHPDIRLYLSEDRDDRRHGSRSGGYGRGGGGNYQRQPEAPRREPAPARRDDRPEAPAASGKGFEYPTEKIDPDDIPF